MAEPVEDHVSREQLYQEIKGPPNVLCKDLMSDQDTNMPVQMIEHPLKDPDVDAASDDGVGDLHQLSDDEGKGEDYEEKDLSEPKPKGSPISILDEITDEGKQEYKCPICTHLIEEPFQNRECGHRFCEKCLDEADGSSCPGCLGEEDTDIIRKLNKDDCFRDKCHKKYMDKLMTKCPTPRCHFKGPLKDYRLHDCPQPVPGLHSSDEEGSTVSSRQPCTSYRQESSSDEEFSRFPVPGATLGSLTMKITNFGRNLVDAKGGKARYIKSIPFYAPGNGSSHYKMYASVHLNGDGMTKGNYMGLYVGMMKGNADDQLDWPPKLKIKLTLIDLEDESNSIDKLFITDPNSTSFQRPTKEENTPTGLAQFCPLQKITSASYGYVRRDTMFVKVEVM